MDDGAGTRGQQHGSTRAVAGLTVTGVNNLKPIRCGSATIIAGCIPLPHENALHLTSSTPFEELDCKLLEICAAVTNCYARALNHSFEILHFSDFVSSYLQVLVHLRVYRP